MRDHNKAFCQVVAENMECPGPIIEFGSYQVAGQEGYANLRAVFPGKDYLGCDMREGPGVDRVADVTAIDMPDGAAGTVLCIETFEHVFEVRRAFDEVFRVLRPGGVFIITSPLNFRIHAYPDDYWRMTPSCLGRMLAPYEARATGHQGHRAFPHTVMGVAIKAPAPADAAARLERLAAAYADWNRRAEAGLPLGAKLRRLAARCCRSKGERRQIADHYASAFQIDAPEQPSGPRKADAARATAAA